jgi:hypothetical protein
MRFRGGEQVFDHQSSVAMASQGSGGGTVFNIDARGAELGVETKIANALDRHDRERAWSSNKYRTG